MVRPFKGLFPLMKFLTVLKEVFSRLTEAFSYKMATNVPQNNMPITEDNATI